MKIRNWGAGLALCAVVLVAAGCAKAPTKEIEEARVVVSRADSLDAATYAPDEMQAAQTALEDAMAKSAAKDYKAARAAAVQAKSSGEAAIAKAESGMTQAKADAEALKAEIPNVMAMAHQAVADAKKSRTARAIQARLDQADSTLVNLDSMMNEATNHFDAGHYMSAKTKFSEIKDQAMAIVDSVSAWSK